MYTELLKIYLDKIVDNIENYDPQKYYYFYKEDGNIFGIEKTISNNEYRLIKSFYLEKTFHYDNIVLQNISEYLFEKGRYPFKKEKGAFFFYKCSEYDEQINSLLNDLFNDIYVFKNAFSSNDFNIVFYFNNFENSIEDVFKTISDDFGKRMIVHKGIFFSKETSGIDIIKYYQAYIKASKLSEKDYSDLSDLLFSIPNDLTKEIAQIVKVNVLDPVLNNIQNQEIIDTFFKNELNVLKTSKVLYMHRNTLINKLDNISKNLGMNIEDFKTACSILVIMRLCE